MPPRTYDNGNYPVPQASLQSPRDSRRVPPPPQQVPPPVPAVEPPWREPVQNPSIAPTGQTIRSTHQKIRTYTNAHNQHLQERIPPNKPFIGLRTAYRPGYAICVIIAGGINLISGILMTALANSHGISSENLTARVLRVLGPVAIVIGIIFLACGLLLLWHFRKHKKRRKWEREHGKGPMDPPSRPYRRPRTHKEYQDRQGTQLPTVAVPVDNYSYYSSVPRESRRTADGRPLRPPPGGDWKYISDLKDATLAPKYPREERKPLDNMAGNKYRMYPYDQSFRTPYPTPETPPSRGMAATPGPSRSQSYRRERREDSRDRRY